MKFAHLFFITVVTTGVVCADTIELNTGKALDGSVLSYANMMFEVQNEKGNVVKLSSGNVARIQFEKGGAAATIETRTAGKREGTVTLYEKAAFNFQPEKGVAEKIPSMLVTKLTLGSESAKDVEVISHGQRVELAKYFPRGKVTIVDFYADWCGPCRAAGPQLEKLAKDDPDVVLRKVDIVKWDSEVAKQFSLHSIPHINVYDGKGKLVKEMNGFGLEGVKSAIAEAKTAGK